MTRVLSLCLTLCILLILPLSAWGIPLMDKGVKAGVTYANVAGEDVDEASGKLGFGGGAWVNFTIINDIGLQTELLYTMKGSVSDAESGESTFSIDYLELPVMATLSLPTASPWSRRLLLMIASRSRPVARIAASARIFSMRGASVATRTIGESGPCSA